jgi:hypothetical protein
MKKSELKEIIKPIVKECIQEALIEEGVLSNIVSEVVKGMSAAPILEQKAPPRQIAREPSNTNLKQQRKRLMSAINKDAYNGVDLFESTQAMSTYEAQDQKPGSVDLGHPNDPGVDISSIVGLSTQIWDKLK